jgi:hypothetical protein
MRISDLAQILLGGQLLSLECTNTHLRRISVLLHEQPMILAEFQLHIEEKNILLRSTPVERVFTNYCVLKLNKRNFPGHFQGSMLKEEILLDFNEQRHSI